MRRDVRLRRAGECKAWDDETVVAWSTHRAESLRSNEALSFLRRVFETINLAKSTQQGVGFILRRNHYLGYAPENYILNYIVFASIPCCMCLAGFSQAVVAQVSPLPFSSSLLFLDFHRRKLKQNIYI
jgi:hypothetical protein